MAATFGEPPPAKTRFDELAARALERRMRLERGTPERPRGMRSGYILWRNGLWKQYYTLDSVEAAIERR
jgi:hypothetical protein